MSEQDKTQEYRAIRMHYIGACALLGRIARHVKDDDDRYCILRAMNDCAELVGMDLVECAGGSFSLGTRE